MKEQTFSSIKTIMEDIFKDTSLAITPQTSQNDISVWDSLNHVRIITAIEKEFNISFELTDMLSFSDVSSICETVIKKQNI